LWWGSVDDPLKDRLGSKTVLMAPNRDVRHLKLGHCPMQSALRICATSGLMHRSKLRSHSIYASALVEGYVQSSVQSVQLFQ
jgi:hypothetical protein